MNICRTCLKTPANKDILQLENALNEDTKNYVDIMVFCLDIKVTKDSKITKNLCNNCYRKIISFYKFKTLSLKNDVYLKSLQPEITLDDTKISVYVDENGIKHENELDPDECGPNIVEDCYTNIKSEIGSEYNIEYEPTEAIKSEIDSQSVEENKKCKESKGDVKENAVRHKKRNHSKKRKRIKVAEVEQQRSVCGECGISVLNLKQHSLVHQPESERNMVRCKLCLKQFTRKSALTRHHNIKHLGLKIECNICNKKVWNVLSHKRRMHNPGALRFGCVQCGRRCESQSALNAHMAAHAYECDICHRKFSAKYLISNHILQVHEKVKPHQCHMCSKAYGKKKYLNDHLRTHTNERPFKCDHCGKCFTSKDSLRKHRLIHSDTTFQCQLCDKSFVRRVNLRTHMITHTKEKKYPCHFCDVRFGRAHHRSSHERTVHQRPA